MKIASVEIFKLNIPFKQGWRIPLGIIDKAANVVVKLITNTGITGWGEASPFAPITGDSQATNVETAKHLAKLVLGKDPLAIEARMHEIRRETVAEPSIRSAYDMALYDILWKAADLPLYAVLGGEKRRLRTDFTIGMQ